MVYLPDVRTFGEMNDAYRAVLMKDFPARTTIQAGLMGAGGAVEIMMTAVK
jgi:enamine deaminase RidA (YjgF/YER057c/UK114 family)